MKKGFTLVELLVIIGLIGLLLVIIVPSTIKILDSSIENTMKIQEEEIEDAAQMYLEDFCKTPIDNTKTCTLSKTVTDGIAYFNGEINLNILVSNNYIDEIKLRDQDCTGKVIFSKNEAQAFLNCGNLYTTDGY